VRVRVRVRVRLWVAGWVWMGVWVCSRAFVFFIYRENTPCFCELMNFVYNLST